MSFAGFGAALGNLFGGVAGSLQEQEKLRMAREFQAKQMEDMGAQMEERKANAAYRLAEAERQKRSLSPEELTRLIVLGQSKEPGSADARAQVVASYPALIPFFHEPNPPSLEHVVVKGKNGESQLANYNKATGKVTDTAGNEIKNPVAYYAPSMVGTVTPQQEHAAARQDVNTIVSMMPRPSKVPQHIFDSTANPAAMKPNPLYAQTVADSLNMQRTQLNPALAELARTSQGMGVGTSTPNVSTAPPPVVPLPRTSQTANPALPPSVNRGKYNTDAGYRAFINQTLNIKP